MTSMASQGDDTCYRYFSSIKQPKPPPEPEIGSNNATELIENLQLDSNNDPNGELHFILKPRKHWGKLKIIAQFKVKIPLNAFSEFEAFHIFLQYFNPP